MRRPPPAARRPPPAARRTRTRMRTQVRERRAAMHCVDQKRVRMPIVPTIWFAVLDAPPEPSMNAW
ncbi:Uncharacterised protein [Burkholderia cepacia]|uniref:Uncharacterized protein n=1 Tax=Burkholderia cepacia TaxID=292 RepID=A0AAE8T1M8_BURCE|nr:Uncharacterised protein [Burkholderia cepacia]